MNLVGEPQPSALPAELPPQFVELLAKFLVVGAKCLDHVPHRLEHRIVERDLGIGVGVDEHRDDDGADGLVLGLADRATDRLHDVHLRPTGVDERHAVERRHVHALRETAGVGEQTPVAVVEVAEVLEQDVPLTGGHLTRGVAGPQLTLRALPGGHPRDDVGHVGGELAGTLDA